MLGMGLGILGGCSALEVSNPTVITNDNVNSVAGAEDLWTVARQRLVDATAKGAIFTGVLTDEYFVDVNGTNTTKFALLDRRQSLPYENSLNVLAFQDVYEDWQQLYKDATVAMPRVRTYMPTGAREARLGELFAIRGFVLLGLAEQICPGFPIRDVDVTLETITPRFTSAPQTADSGFTRALAQFDSAMVYATIVDSARVLDLARVGRGRALLGLGRYAEAQTAVAAIDPAYLAMGTADVFNNTGASVFTSFRGSGATLGVSDVEGGTGLNYVDATDLRIALTPTRLTRNPPSNQMYAPRNYVTAPTMIALASGIEAQLIIAEAQLAATPNDTTTWLRTLNALRRTNIVPALSDTTVLASATLAQRVDLLFHERAFWLFGTGHRVGDLRRLIAYYGRDPETVFPTGANRVNAPYGTATSIPFKSEIEHRLNPAITGCLSR